MTGTRQVPQTLFAQIALGCVRRLADLTRGETLVERGKPDHQLEPLVVKVNVDRGRRRDRTLTPAAASCIRRRPPNRMTPPPSTNKTTPRLISAS